MSASNYFIYKNPTMGPTGKWQWLPTDFDGTFDNGSPISTVDTYKNWYDFKDGDRPLVSKLILQNKDINALFEQVLKELVSTAFKPEALVPRIQTYNKMLSLDAQWDISLIRKSPGINNGLTFDDFNNNLNVRTKDMSFGLIPLYCRSRTMWPRSWASPSRPVWPIVLHPLPREATRTIMRTIAASLIRTTIPRTMQDQEPCLVDWLFWL